MQTKKSKNKDGSSAKPEWQLKLEAKGIKFADLNKKLVLREKWEAM